MVSGIHVGVCVYRYLFWSVSRGLNEALYRVDLAELDGPHAPISSATPILTNVPLQAFVVDPLEYKLYFPNHTMMSVYLSRVQDLPEAIHHNTQVCSTASQPPQSACYPVF